MMSESNMIVINNAIANAIARNNVSMNAAIAAPTAPAAIAAHPAPAAHAAASSGAQLVVNDTNTNGKRGPSRKLSTALNKLSVRCDDIVRNPSCGLSTMPAELIGEIGSYLKKEDLDNVRLVSRDFKYAVDYHYGKIMVADCTIFPTFASIERWLDFFRLHPGWAGLARTVTLVGEGLREHEHGGDWAWERLTDAERVYPTADDWAIINTVMDEFEEYINKDGGFCYGGDYRIKIEELFGCLPNLKDILCRKLLPGEHVPGWDGPELLKGLSFYHAELNTNQIFYGDWRYDILHNRVTKWIDEYGEEYEEPNAGPQAQFIDDVLAARDTGFQADVFY